MRQLWVWRTGYERVGLLGVVKPEGARRPAFYFYGYDDWEHERRVFFPFGVHWLVQLWRDVRLVVLTAIASASHLSYRERVERAAYKRGYERGWRDSFNSSLTSDPGGGKEEGWGI